MKKLLFAICIGLPLLAVVIAAGLWFGLDYIVKTGFESVVPKVTNSKASLQKVDIDIFAGRITLTNLVIGNPEGYRNHEAMRFGRILLRVDKSTVTANPVVIHEIEVEAPVVNYERKGKTSNIETIQANVGKYVKDATTSLGGREAEAPGKPERRYIVDSLVVRDARVSVYTALSQEASARMTIPELHRNNLGRAEGGLTSGQLADALLAGLVSDVARNAADSTASPLIKAGKAVESFFGGLFKK